MISAIAWIPKGIAKPIPETAEPPSKEEIEELKNEGPSEEDIQEALQSGALDKRGDSDDEEDEGDMDVDDADKTDDVAHALAVAEAIGKAPKKSDSSSQPKDIADALKELDMDHYDDEDDGIELFSKGLGNVYYPSNEMDPYLKENDDDDSDEEENLAIKQTDSVIVCAHNEDDFSHLQVCIYEESDDGESNLYVHHEIVISAFPLSTAWLDCPLKGGERGNFIAVGSMEPYIEIWDLDVMDEVEPCMVLGGVAEKKKKKKTKTSIKYKEGSHTDSVLGLAWNKEFRNLLASASADKQVKIWDVASGQCSITMEHHTDKVQAVAWNHHVPHILLSGSFDRSIVMKDGRKPSHSGFKWPVTADVEALAWDPHNEHSFLVSLEDGTVKGFDIRTATSDSSSEPKPSFTLHAHEKAVCTLAYNTAAPNLLATGSTDKMVKLWDLSNNQPSCVASQNLKAGAVFSVSFSVDDPFLLAIGGSKGRLQVWDILSDEGIARKYGNCKKTK